MTFGILAARDNEGLKLYWSKPDHPKGTLYQICMLPVVFPESEMAEHCTPYTILCLGQYRNYDGAWGWLPLEAQTKDDIGNYIMNNSQNLADGVDELLGRWLYMDLFTWEDDEEE